MRLDEMHDFLESSLNRVTLQFLSVQSLVDYSNDTVTIALLKDAETIFVCAIEESQLRFLKVPSALSDLGTVDYTSELELFSLLIEPVYYALRTAGCRMSLSAFLGNFFGADIVDWQDLLAYIFEANDLDFVNGNGYVRWGKFFITVTDDSVVVSGPVSFTRPYEDALELASQLLLVMSEVFNSESQEYSFSGEVFVEESVQPSEQGGEGDFSSDLE